MAALPELVSPTVAALRAAREAAQRPYHSIGLPAGGFDTGCDRRLWYRFRWAHPPERHDGKKLRRFETGNIEEARIIADLKAAGMRVEDVDPATGRQRKVRLLAGHVRGKTDGRIWGVPDAPVKMHVLECKSTNGKAFAQLAKYGMQVAKPAHYIQTNLYMHGEGTDRALYICVNTDDDDEHAERVEFNLTFTLQVLARAERIVRTDRAPARIHDDPNAKAAWACGTCPAFQTCHAGAFAERNCRTCLHATPEMDGDARWTCVRWKHDLTIDQQQAGCPSHLYLPDLVPGEQVDADEAGEWVDYRLPDGRVRRDGPATEVAA